MLPPTKPNENCLIFVDLVLLIVVYTFYIIDINFLCLFCIKRPKLLEVYLRMS